MLTKRMKTELVKTGRTETGKYIYRLNEKDPAQLPIIERIEKKYMGTTGYYYNANTYKKYNFCLFPNCNENVTLL